MVTANYHSWGFMSMSLGQCQPLFQELLLLLQPLSVLPFDLNLLLEPRLLRNRQLCSDEDVSPPPPCSALLVTSWPLLQADKKAARDHGGQPATQQGVSPHQESPGSQGEERQSRRSPRLAPIPEWGPMHDEEDCSNADNWSQISMCSRGDEQRGERDPESLSASSCVQAESPHQGGRRWAKLFGGADSSSRSETLLQSHTGAQSRRYIRSHEPASFPHSSSLRFIVAFQIQTTV